MARPDGHSTIPVPDKQYLTQDAGKGVGFSGEGGHTAGTSSSGNAEAGFDSSSNATGTFTRSSAFGTSTNGTAGLQVGADFLFL
ncbi:hypothetical protein N7499_008918 [Penicillium canescens]|uniref:Uncharacterized protein n=1 Tax=Penicillium canescens TaxID=5083 RepID=A0AAD6I0K1_PENCN|nr:uncharacterized protein N7446_013890 [Penicillium canescens]KAJ5984863.1 hypothetical protein N7522_012059 [Penicillium canescens]KAJ6023525.1 hypothetical protein N7460_013920 [Penicillium canescens]KAJ6025200.1 hypothetical protein N7444_012879 [Penicillium canescens]KAJ6042824.1 hypothetical protein N7446_013890 [Penicillium canescens]KAJ6076937.1 hypothetical protein N7499_008918 [Penicillium canescens]